MSAMGRAENQGTSKPRIASSHIPPAIAKAEPIRSIGQLTWALRLAPAFRTLRRHTPSQGENDGRSFTWSIWRCLSLSYTLHRRSAYDQLSIELGCAGIIGINITIVTICIHGVYDDFDDGCR